VRDHEETQIKVHSGLMQQARETAEAEDEAALDHHYMILKRDDYKLHICSQTSGLTAMSKAFQLGLAHA
jgi:hypothetical protein